MAKQSVSALSKKASDLNQQIKAQKAVDSKAISVVNKAEQTLTRAQKTYEREEAALMKMNPSLPVVTLQAQKTKVSTFFFFEFAPVCVCVCVCVSPSMIIFWWGMKILLFCDFFPVHKSTSTKSTRSCYHFSPPLAS